MNIHESKKEEESEREKEKHVWETGTTGLQNT